MIANGCSNVGYGQCPTASSRSNPAYAHKSSAGSNGSPRASVGLM
eukprot:CAMPEP_0175849234 /NCGR_PEP_ID=MMETSP0107_2-20121207/24389_1 /TAXON_ID=195067 ORGANISM="Goniomonas pacifica, Strain CCMP1869" /NCGR_SAMPLE_ID=MMETSP0107_2 /ASSEMBLY_ACC=CAM_ASM_000203 /LENGTH=44 /DNA_ID= /DNA_START= /DNA_END= /DNA_ORIENTATION=